MKILLLSVLAVAMIGLMIPSTFAEEKVPDWVKNTAGWWATDQIEESEFLKALEFMIKHEIIQISETAIIPTVTEGLAGSIRIEEIESISSSDYHMFSIPLNVSINSGFNWGEAH